MYRTPRSNGTVEWPPEEIPSEVSASAPRTQTGGAFRLVVDDERGFFRNDDAEAMLIGSVDISGKPCGHRREEGVQLARFTLGDDFDTRTVREVADPPGDRKPAGDAGRGRAKSYALDAAVNEV